MSGSVFVAPVGVTVYVKGENINECVRLAVREWAAECPDEVRIHKKHMDQLKASLYNSNGMSMSPDGKKGNLMFQAEIPVSLGNRIQRMTHKDWLKDNQIMRALALECPFIFHKKPAKGNTVIVDKTLEVK